MLAAIPERGVMDEQTIELIAQRVIAAIRDDLDAIVAELSRSAQTTEQLTVGEVARRLGVARSTVYAHWREWGGYKLGAGDKAPIRFDSKALPIAKPAAAPPHVPTIEPTRKRTPRRRRRGDVLVAAPKLVRTLDASA